MAGGGAHELTADTSALEIIQALGPAARTLTPEAAMRDAVPPTAPTWSPTA